MDALGPLAQLALNTIHHQPDRRTPSHFFNIMEHSAIERLGGGEPGSYRRDPHGLYCAMVRAMPSASVDQYLAENPLSMESHGYEALTPGATTGAEHILVDDMEISSPEAVVTHLERWVFPRLATEVAAFDARAHIDALLAFEASLQTQLGPEVLKIPYGWGRLPCFAYGAYGYEHYFSAYALYPEVIERHFSLQADLAASVNRAVAAAWTVRPLPPMLRLDHDMADSRGILVRPSSLEQLWFPHFARSVEPLRSAGIRLVWHCDGNVSDMVDPLIECGVSGFQGFQYECGVDYPALCRRRAADGSPLLIFAGVSVTRTLPYGSPADVRREVDWLVANGPPTGLFLATSSSVAPGVPYENLLAMREAFRHYQTVGRPT